MDDARFEELAEEALALLPPKFLRHLANVEIVIEQWPSADDLAEAGMEGEEPSSLLGLYSGVPLPERESSGYAELPDQIVLYQGSILAAAGDDPEEVRSEVRKTVLHEIGHFFGISEDRLAELGLD